MMRRILDFRKNIIIAMSLIIGQIVSVVVESVRNGCYQLKEQGSMSGVMRN